ncbi:hypothetical protein BDN72DRAFT_727827, partial [Pluteus cervinus]
MADTFQPLTSDLSGVNIHKLLTPDLLHQLIKGIFKDRLVAWIVESSLTVKIGLTKWIKGFSKLCLRIKGVPAFPELRRFPVGRGFKQQTGNGPK